MEALEQFTHALNVQTPDNACQHCAKHDQWVSHGYVYKQEAMDKRSAIGKRIVCSNRYGKSGCGRSRQLYLSEVIPNKHYRLTTMMAFIDALMKGSGVSTAYREAVGTSREARQAWRWLTGMFKQLGRWRTLLHQSESWSIARTYRTHRLSILLPTLQKLLQDNQAIQQSLQQAFF